MRGSETVEVREGTGYPINSTLSTLNIIEPIKSVLIFKGLYSYSDVYEVSLSLIIQT